MDRIKLEQHRLVAMRGAGDKIGARAEQKPVGNDLPPARRVAIVEGDLNAGQQRLAKVSENGRVGERARSDRAGEGLGAKLRLDIDGKPAPVRLAQARADFRAQRAQARGAASVPARFQGTGGGFELGQFLGRRRGGEIAKAARSETKPDLSAVLDPVEPPNAASTASRIRSALRRDAWTTLAISSSVRPSAEAASSRARARTARVGERRMGGRCVRNWRTRGRKLAHVKSRLWGAGRIRPFVAYSIR